MPGSLPSDLALTTIANDALIVASDHRNNYSAIQSAVNDMLTAMGVTAKGDLLVATASGALTNLARGSDGQVLTADSAQTAGVKWGAAIVYPKLVDADVYMTAIAQTNWNTVSANTNMIGGGANASTGAQNAEINWDLLLGAGTWTVELMHTQGADRGIYTVQLSSDGGVTFTSVGSAPYSGSGSTIDGYAAAATYNVRSALTGITIGASQVYRLKLKMATQNGSSSSFVGCIQALQLRRTA